MTESHELAWAAGLFDGEGCISFTDGIVRATGWRYYAFFLIVSQKQERRILLERFKRAVGDRGRIYGPHKHEMCHWKVRNVTDIMTILQMLWPWLSAPKKQQARFAVLKVRTYIVSKPKHQSALSRIQPTDLPA